MEREELQLYKGKTGYNLRQLELDYYQHFVLSKIYEGFNTIYFKGGTCLQKCYGIKRFSEDLDFNFFDLQPGKIVSLIEDLFAKSVLISGRRTYTENLYKKLYGRFITTCQIISSWRSTLKKFWQRRSALL